MGQFRREGGSDRGFGGGRDRDRGGFGGGKRGFGDDREPKTMHRATCSDCGRSCEVPFRPTGEKPVYCSECFGKQQDSGGYGRDSRSSGRDFGRDRSSSFDRPRFEDKKMFSATCDTCGNRCEVPFRPTAGKPVFCDACFGKSGSSMNASAKSGSACNCKDGFAAINAKLDRIIKALNIPAAPKVFNDEIEELIEEIAKAEKPAKKAKKETILDIAEEVEAPKKKRIAKKK